MVNKTNKRLSSFCVQTTWAGRNIWPGTLHKQCTKALKKLPSSFPEWERSRGKTGFAMPSWRWQSSGWFSKQRTGLRSPTLGSSSAPRERDPSGAGDSCHGMGWSAGGKGCSIPGFKSGLTVTHSVTLSYHLYSPELTILIANWKDCIKKQLSNLLLFLLSLTVRTGFQATCSRNSNI